MNGLYVFSLICTFAIQILLIVLMVFGIVALAYLIKVLKRNSAEKNIGQVSEEAMGISFSASESDLKSSEDSEENTLE